jgi:hypothetical protein
MGKIFLAQWAKVSAMENLPVMISILSNFGILAVVFLLTSLIVFVPFTCHLAFQLEKDHKRTIIN